MKTIHVIGLGLGPDHVGPAARKLIEAADLLAGGIRLLEFFPDFEGERLSLTNNLADWLERVVAAAASKNVVVLASGDPNYYGIAGRLIQKAGAEHVRILPNITTVQAAFAELKETWADLVVVSLHGRNVDALYSAVRENTRVAVFTDTTNTPARIARLLLDRGQENWRMTVLENLGTEETCIRQCELEEAVTEAFSPLNLVVLHRTEPPATLTLGTPDDEFEHEAGLITKAEVRAAALGKLALGPDLTLWDLGAGCGSVGLEATLLMPRGRVIAVERKAERVGMIEANRAKFGAANLDIVHGELPGALENLPRPDRVFIGGGGNDLGEIIRICWSRLSDQGIIVAAVVRLDSLSLARQAFTGLGSAPDVVQAQFSRGAPLGGDFYLKALNPVWLVSGRKTEIEEA